MTESASRPDPRDGVGDDTQAWRPDPDETRVLSPSDWSAAGAGRSDRAESERRPDERVQAERAESERARARSAEPGVAPSPAWGQASDPARPVNPDPSGANPHGGYGAPAYSAEPTAMYQPVTAEQPYAPTTGAQSYAPAGAPPYAPAAPPPAYGSGALAAVPVVVMPPPGAGPVPRGSRAVAGLLSALIGLLLSVGGCYLLFRFGYEVYVLRNVEVGSSNSTVVLRMVLAGVGVLLLVGAVLLNAWSAWATVLPGVALLGAGIAAFLSPTIASRMDSWGRWLFRQHETVTWNVVGATMTFGAILLATSLLAAIARAAGRRSAAATVRA